MKDGKCLIFDTGEKAIREIDEEGLKGLWSGEVVALRPRFKQTEFYSSFKWLFMEFFRFRSIFYEVVGASFFIQSFGLVTPLFIQVIIDKVLPHHAVATLQVVAAAFLTVIVFESFMNFLRNYLLYHTANKIDAGLGGRVYRHLLSLPYRYFETRRVGNIIARVRELENLRQFMTNVSLTVLLDTVFSVVFIVIMALYSVTLTLMVLAFVAVIALVSFVATPHIKAKLDEKFHKGAMAQSFLVESITGIQTVKSMALEGKMVKNWENHLGDYIQSAFNLANVGNVAVTASQALQKLMTLAVIYFGVGLVFDNRLSVGQLIAFQMFASQLSGPILRLVHMWQDFQQARLSLERIGDIVNTPSEVTGGSVSLRDLKGSIVFKDVKFRYAHDGPLVLDGVSLAHPARRDDRHRGPQRLGQEHRRQARPAPLSPAGGRHRRRQRRPAPHGPAVPAPPDRHGAPGQLPLQRHDPRKHHHGHARCRHGAGHGRLADRRGPRVHLRDAPGLRQHCGGEGRVALRRPAPEDLDCAGAHHQPEVHHLRRGDKRPGL